MGWLQQIFVFGEGFGAREKDKVEKGNDLFEVVFVFCRGFVFSSMQVRGRRGQGHGNLGKEEAC